MRVKIKDTQWNSIYVLPELCVSTQQSRTVAIKKQLSYTFLSYMFPLVIRCVFAFPTKFCLTLSHFGRKQIFQYFFSPCLLSLLTIAGNQTSKFRKLSIQERADRRHWQPSSPLQSFLLLTAAVQSSVFQSPFSNVICLLQLSTYNRKLRNE